MEIGHQKTRDEMELSYAIETGRIKQIAATEARHVAGQVAMADPRAAQLLALFQMSDERGKITLLAIAGIHAARYPKEKS